MQNDPDDLTVVIMNLKNDGGPRPARRRLPDRWHQAYKGILVPLEPDLVAVTE